MNVHNIVVSRAGRLLLAFVLAATSLATQAQSNSIEAIDVSQQAGDKTVVKVTLREAPANPPAGFTVNNPPRIAFDFPDTSNALGRSVQEIGEGDLRRINVVQSAGRTRMVFELSRNMSHDTQIEGRSLLITLQATGAAAAAATGVTQTFSRAQPGDRQHSLRDIDFRRGRSGEGRVVVDLSDNAVGIDLKQQGKTIVVDFINTALPSNLERRLDVLDFGTPVQTIDASARGPNTRVVITPRGNWEHSAYQTDNRFIVEVKEIIEDPTKLVQGTRKGYVGEKLSLNFQNVEVRAVLQVIADFTGLNIITSDTVSGNLTLRLKDVPWDQALDIILQSKGLDLRKSGNVVWIAPRDELATKEKLALEAKQQIADLEPTRTESFQLNYQKAEAFKTILADEKQRILSKRGSAVIDARTNTIFVQDTPTRLEEVRRLIQRVDVPVRQVMIESRIVEASDTFSRNLGVRLGHTDLTQLKTGQLPGNRVGGQNYVIGGNLQSVGVQTGQTTDYPQSFVPDSLNVNLPAPAIAGTQAGVFSFFLFNDRGTRFLNLELSALQADGKGKIISSPRVITADQVEATIEQGTEIPYQQATSSGATSISFKKATLSLKVKPQITPDDNVIMNLRVHKDSVGQTTLAGPSIDTKQIVTEVLVENGGTVVIGGIYTQEERSTTNKVPVLGDLPYVGFLFKQNLKTDDRRELLIFITPKILKEGLALRR